MNYIPLLLIIVLSVSTWGLVWNFSLKKFDSRSTIPAVMSFAAFITVSFSLMAVSPIA
jgi:hypothetical protein